MTKEIDLAKRCGYMQGVREASEKIREALDKFPLTKENFELRQEIMHTMLEMLGKSTE